MTRRWLIAAAVLIVIGALIAWIAPRVYWEETSVPMPLRGEARTNPFYTAQRLVEELGGRSERRRAMDQKPPVDAVLVLADWHWSLIESRRRALEAWVEDGGRLVIDATLVGGDDELAAWTGIAREYPAPAPEPEEGAPQNEPAEAQPPAEEETAEEETGEEDADDDAEDCWTLEVSHGGSALNPVGGEYWTCNFGGYSWLTSEREPAWALHDGDDFQAVRVRVGRGSVTFLNAMPFGNRDLLRHDHARLFADIVQLRRGDLVLFASEEEHASLLALIWIHGAPVVVLTLLFIGLALWRGGMRFGPMEAAPALARRSLAEQIRGTGQFILRAGEGRALHAAMVRAVHEAAARRIPGYARLPASERIDAIGKLADVDQERLAANINYSGARRPHDLKRDIALLDETRERLKQRQG